MKKVILFLACIVTSTAFAQENKSWRVGASFGLNGNEAQFSGGMTEANGRFFQDDFGSAALDFIARYDYDKHWMAMFGLGFTSTGYQFALSEDYSLVDECNRFSTIQSDFGKVEIPAMVFYKFNPNCKNGRWLVGGGVVITSIEAKTVSSNFETSEGNTNSDYLSSTSTSFGGTSLCLRWSVAREKIFKNGSFLNVAFVVNAGFSEITSAKVNYTVDNQNYEHQYSNNGNFVGLRFSYFLKPFGSNIVK